MGNQFSDPVEKESFYFHMKAGAESGWDYSTRWMINEQVCFSLNYHFRPGVGNSFDSAGHIRDILGIRGPVHLLLVYNKY
jgi:hypothetical protein